MTSFVSGPATRADNLPGASAGPPSNYVPPARGDALTTMPADTTATQFAELAHDNARRQYEAWRGTVPAHLLAAHARDFAATPAVLQAAQAADAVTQRALDAQAEADRIRSGLSVPLDAAAQTRAHRWWQSQLPMLDRAGLGGVAGALNDLASHATDWQLAVIAEMAPPLLSAKGLDPDLVTAFLEQNVAVLKAANAARQKATQAHSIVQANRRSLEKSIRQGTVTSSPVSAASYDPDRS